MLISADEILGFHPSCVPKMPASPLMAFYIGHINLHLSPPEGIALYWPQSIHRTQDLRLVNELQEGSGRSVKHSQVDTHHDPLWDESSPIASGRTAGRMQGGFNLSRVTASINHVIRRWVRRCGLLVCFNNGPGRKVVAANSSAYREWVRVTMWIQGIWCIYLK